MASRAWLGRRRGLPAPLAAGRAGIAVRTGSRVDTGPIAQESALRQPSIRPRHRPRLVSHCAHRFRAWRAVAPLSRPARCSKTSRRPDPPQPGVAPWGRLVYGSCLPMAPGGRLPDHGRFRNGLALRSITQRAYGRHAKRRRHDGRNPARSAANLAATGARLDLAGHPRVDPPPRRGGLCRFCSAIALRRMVYQPQQRSAGKALYSIRSDGDQLPFAVVGVDSQLA